MFFFVFVFLLLIVFNKEWDDSMWSFLGGSECVHFMFFLLFIYVLPLESNFFKILLYFKCIYIHIIFKEEATDEL